MRRRRYGEWKRLQRHLTVELGYACAGTPSTCTTGCGDGIKAGAEACDDGNANTADGCAACAIQTGFTCTGTAPSVCSTTCGDNIMAGNEQCEPPNQGGCNASCVVEQGSGGSGGGNNGTTTICGDGIKAGSEACDDGNNTVDDGCTSCEID